MFYPQTPYHLKQHSINRPKIPLNTIYQNYFLEFKQNEIMIKLREHFGCLKSSAIFWCVHTRTVTLRGVVIHKAGLMKVA